MIYPIDSGFWIWLCVAVALALFVIMVVSGIWWNKTGKEDKELSTFRIIPAVLFRALYSPWWKKTEKTDKGRVTALIRISQTSGILLKMTIMIFIFSVVINIISAI